MTDTDKPVVTDEDRRRATEVDDRCASGEINPVDAIALALAETRMLTTRILEQDHDRRLHRVAESKDARIAELEREQKILQQEMRALSEKIINASETPEAVAIRHLKRVDQDPLLRPAEKRQP